MNGRNALKLPGNVHPSRRRVDEIPRQTQTLALAHPLQEASHPSRAVVITCRNLQDRESVREFKCLPVPLAA